jgi:hypothetical protein
LRATAEIENKERRETQSHTNKFVTTPHNLGLPAKFPARGCGLITPEIRAFRKPAFWHTQTLKGDPKEGDENPPPSLFLDHAVTMPQQRLKRAFRQPGPYSLAHQAA